MPGSQTGSSKTLSENINMITLNVDVPLLVY